MRAALAALARRPYLAAAAVVVRRLPGLDGARRAEVADTLAALAAEPGAARWRELASVAGLRVRLLARADTADAPAATWRQGAHRGGCLLALATAVPALAQAAHRPEAATVAGAAALVVALWAAVRGARAVALPLLAGGGLAVAATLAPGAGAGPLATRAAVALAALALGEAPGRDAGALCPARWMAALAVAAPLAAAGAGAELAVVGVVLTGAVPALWLAGAWVDARLAVGAAVVLGWRFVAVDLHELGAAAAALGRGEAVDPLLARWVLMGAALAGAVTVARAAVRRAATP